MKPITHATAKRSRRLLVMVFVFSFIASLPLLACAFARTNPSVAVTIVNNSNLEFRHAYLAPNGNDWGSDQLNGSVIGAGATYTLSNVACSGANAKVIVEDQNGCFLYQPVSCSESSSWTIGANPSPDCGG